MANLGVVMREEIQRLARKEVKRQMNFARQAILRHRAEIAQLKRLVCEQDKKITQLKKQKPALSGVTSKTAENPLAGVRYSARSVRAQRKRLKLSAENYGRLIGVSGLTVYNWEHEKSRPRQSQLARLVAVRQLGRRQAAQRLLSVK